MTTGESKQTTNVTKIYVNKVEKNYMLWEKMLGKLYNKK